MEKFETDVKNMLDGGATCSAPALHLPQHRPMKTHPHTRKGLIVKREESNG
jgi:hypothetical protein